MILESRGQISAEYLLLLGSLIVILMISISFIASQNELTMAMVAARSGVNEGSLYASSAIYPSDIFNDYSKKDYEILEELQKFGSMLAEIKARKTKED